MKAPLFRRADLQQLESLGIPEDRVRAQIELFHKSSFFVKLKKPCTLQDGVRRLSADETHRCLLRHGEAAQTGRFSRFVPASGAASRMFQSLLQIYHMPQFLEPKELHRRAEVGVAVAVDFLKFLDGIYYFPFLEDLERVLERDALDLDNLLFDCQYRTILDYLLTDVGLNYGSLPKGLLTFHRYPGEGRTAFEEHLVESSYYAVDSQGAGRIHFTVAPEHRAGFEELAERLGPRYEERLGMRLDISFSEQRRETDTIAVDMRNRPFRDRFGRLLFRPGGHGALLENLNDLQQDLVYIKNVDNVIHDRFKETVGFWKRVLGGFLVAVEESVHEHVRRLSREGSAADVEQACRFAREELLVPIPESYPSWDLPRKRNYLLHRLDRPIRVCGVVQNVGEPGGAPFWVEDRNGDLSIQIVEKAQVDFQSTEQRDIWMSSTHFNPVDLVCSVRNHCGRPFDLRTYVDHEAVFIAVKSKDGKSLKALELPGLWNGAMAGWLTLIVEVPRITFNPVKTVFDLLRPEHQLEETPSME